jgi:uncharacterized protein (DUF1499 family)
VSAPAPGPRAWLARFWTNDVETGATPAYPDVLPLELPMGADDAYRIALEAARSMPLWTIHDEDPGERRLYAVASTRRMKFVDDVEVWVEPLARSSRVHARSASRIGFTDFGTNARRLRAYLARVADLA